MACFTFLSSDSYEGNEAVKVVLLRIKADEEAAQEERFMLVVEGNEAPTLIDSHLSEESDLPKQKIFGA